MITRTLKLFRQDWWTFYVRSGVDFFFLTKKNVSCALCTVHCAMCIRTNLASQSEYRPIFQTNKNVSYSMHSACIHKTFASQ